MKVIFHGYNTCCQNESGGVQNRMKTICRLLNEREGVETELFNPCVSKINDCDILHLFMLKYENFDLIKYAKGLGKKVVISTIVNVSQESGFKIRMLAKIPFWHVKMLKYDSARLADMIITESDRESAFVSENYHIPASKIRKIPNGFDLRRYDGKDIYEQIGNIEKYAVVVGRFDENKNQINVINALKGTGVHVVFIGGPSASSDYYYKCIQIAGNDEHFHFLGWVEHDSDLFMSALSNADTLIFPSFDETFGLVALEAGATGCKLAISKTLPILEYNSFKECGSFEPNSLESIKECVLNIMAQPKTDILASKIKDEFSWDRVIDQHIEIYQSLLRE